MIFLFLQPEHASPAIQGSQHTSTSPPLKLRSLSPGDRPILPTRSGRIRRFPKHYRDFKLGLPAPLPHTIPKKVAANPTPLPHTRSPSPSRDTVTSTVPNVIETEPDSFGLYRVYTDLPIFDPSDEACIYDMCDAPTFTIPPTSSQASISTRIRETFFTPFANPTIYRLFSWFYNGNISKSIADLNDLVVNVLLAPDFDKEHLHKFDAARELNRLDEHMKNPHLSADNGWLEGSVKIRLPATRKKFRSKEQAPEFEVTSIHYRKLTQVIKSAFQDPLAKKIHFFPFKLFWCASPDSPPERVITEVYNSDAYLEEHEKLKSLPREPGCNLETVIAAILVYSDSTHLTNFGTASLWPIYVFFGNLSKYIRGLPTSFAAHHLAYMPSVCFSFFLLGPQFTSLISFVTRYQTWSEIHTRNFSERHHLRRF